MADTLITNLSNVTSPTGAEEIPVNVPGTPHTDGKVVLSAMASYVKGTIGDATVSVAGLATAAQITKLDGIKAGSDVTGPASATDNAIARFDGTTGKLIQNTSAATLSDVGYFTAGGYSAADGIGGSVDLLSDPLSLRFMWFVDPDHFNIQIKPDTTGLDSYVMILPPTQGAAGQVLAISSVSGDELALQWSSPAGGNALTTSPLSQFAATTSAQLAGVISDETGSGALVFANSPTLVTPALGTPASGVLTNCTGLPVAGLASFVGLPVEYSVALGDETTAATGSTTVPKITWRSPCALANVTVRFECVTAPTGSVAILDIHEAGTSIFEGGSGVKPQIAISATTSVGGAVPGVVHDTSIADNAVLEFFIDQVGSTIAGAGYKATIKATRA